MPSWDALVAEAAPAPTSALRVTPAVRTASLTLSPTRLSGRAGSSPPVGPVETSLPTPVEPVGTGAPHAAVPRSFDDLRHPCAGCDAYCCTSHVFGKPTPTTNVELDFWRFCLGFPGIEAAIGPSGWQLIVSTTCRHLDDAHQCSVYGQPERPLKCGYYDAWKCAFKPLLGPVPTSTQRRMGLAEFDVYLAGLRFDETGTLV